MSRRPQLSGAITHLGASTASIATAIILNVIGQASGRTAASMAAKSGWEHVPAAAVPAPMDIPGRPW